MAVQKVQESTVIIVGAGPSGLATAASLSNLSIQYIILEREDCLGSLWKKYAYDRVHLHVAKQFAHLPLKPIPDSCSTYLSRKEFIHYLDDYASHFKINPIYNQSVEMATYDNFARKWHVKAKNPIDDEVKDYACSFLVVATGELSNAFIPKIEGLESFDGEITHSTQYKNGKKFSDKHVLVVGSGNSGMEIALDLTNNGAETSIVVRSPTHILSRSMIDTGLGLWRFFCVSFVDSVLIMMSKIVYGDVSKYGIQRPKDGPLVTQKKYGRYPVIDIGTIDKIKAREIAVFPGVKHIKGKTVVFENGKESSFDVIVFATGYKRSTNKWLKDDDYLLNEDGLPKPEWPNHWKGKNGLYCSGLSRSGLLGASMDAQNVARDIKTFL